MNIPLHQGAAALYMLSQAGKTEEVEKENKTDSS